MKRKLLVGGLLLYTFASSVIAQRAPGEFPWQVGRQAAPSAQGNQIRLVAIGAKNGITQLMICDLSGRPIAVVDAVVCNGELVATLPKGMEGASYRLVNSKEEIR